MCVGGETGEFEEYRKQIRVNDEKETDSLYVCIQR